MAAKDVSVRISREQQEAILQLCKHRIAECLSGPQTVAAVVEKAIDAYLDEVRKSREKARRRKHERHAADFMRRTGKPYLDITEDQQP